LKWYRFAVRLRSNREQGKEGLQGVEEVAFAGAVWAVEDVEVAERL
jgi:hypothetical protein